MAKKIKSVSELNKLKPAQQKIATQQAMEFSEEEIKDIFNNSIWPNTPSDIRIKLLQSGKAEYDATKAFSYYANLESLVIMMDIMLQSRNVEFCYDSDDLSFDLLVPAMFKRMTKAPITIADQSFRGTHSLIHYCISMVSDEYYIENNKIYPTRNQRTIAAVKKLNNDDLNEILQYASVSSDYKILLASLSKFLEKHRRTLEQKIGAKQVGVFFEFVNTSNIRHGKGEQKNPTHLELEIFFDFGISLARMAL